MIDQINRSVGSTFAAVVEAITRAATLGVALLIKVYRYAISPMFGQHCRFHPSCSAYALGAIEKHGLSRGGLLALRRVGKCHPWHPGGLDPVPDGPASATHGMAQERGR